MDSRLSQFVHGLYFDIQTIEGVQSLEIWNGIRESFDSYEKTGLIRNLYKIVIPLVNERCFGRSFDVHSRLAKKTVAAAIRWFLEDPEERFFARFPYPPTGDGDQKELYRLVKARAALLLADVDAAVAAEEKPPTQALPQGVFPGGLFDFREMRIVDNELPFIIFTVITRLIVGGAQENTVSTCIGLRKLGHEVDLVIGPQTGPEGSLYDQAKAAGVPIMVVDELRRTPNPWLDVSAGRALRRLFLGRRYDVVHTHSGKAGSDRARRGRPRECRSWCTPFTAHRFTATRIRSATGRFGGRNRWPVRVQRSLFRSPMR